MSATQRSPFERLLLRAYTSANRRSQPHFAQDRHDYVFHINEALPELIALTNLAANPVATPKEAYRIVQSVLIHATGHLAGAARIDGGFCDPFQTPAPRRAKAKRRKPASSPKRVQPRAPRTA